MQAKEWLGSLQMEISAMGKIKPRDLVESDWVQIGFREGLWEEGNFGVQPPWQVDSGYVNLRGEFCREGK